jgi:hypothetical protein
MRIEKGNGYLTKKETPMRSFYFRTTLLTLFLALVLDFQSAEAAVYKWPTTRLRGMVFSLGSSEADMQYLATNWKANAARLQWVTETLLTDSAEFNQLTKVVGWCKKYQLYAWILGVSQYFNYDNMGGFWTNAAMQDNYIQMWQKIATFYKNSGDGIGYYIFSEPFACGVTQLNQFHARLTDSIRAIDKSHPIILDSPDWANPDYYNTSLNPAMAPTTDSNTVYGFHYYNPKSYTHQSDGSVPFPANNKATIQQHINNAIAFGKKYNVPIFAGEFGCVYYAPSAELYMKDCMDVWEANGLSWCAYAYREWDAMNYENNSRIVTVLKAFFALPVTPVTQIVQNPVGERLMNQPFSSSARIIDVLGRTVQISPTVSNRGNNHNSNGIYFSAANRAAKQSHGRLAILR